MPQLEFRNYRFFINPLQVYALFLIWFRSTKARLKKGVSQLDGGLEFGASGVLKVQSGEVIMGSSNMDSKLKVKENDDKMSK